MAQPWERLADESAKAFEAFVAYRDMGADRSLAKVAQQLGKSNTLIERWSARDHWVRRVDAWDIEQDRVHRQFLVNHRRETDRRQLRIANAMQGKLVGALAGLDVGKMGARDLAYWLDVTSKIQRAALGQADRVEMSGPDGGPIELAQLSPDQARERLMDLQREIGRRVEANPDEPPLAFDGGVL